MQQRSPDETLRAALQRSHARLRRQHELVVEFGVASLKSHDLDDLLDRACAVVAQGMATRFAKVLVPVGEGDDLVISHGVGWDEADIGSVRIGGDQASPAGYAIATYRPVLSNHLGEEQRFGTPALMKKYGIQRAINVPIRGVSAPFGVLEADSSDGDDFMESDLVFMEGIANVISMALERLSAETEVQTPLSYSESVLNASPDCVEVMSTDGLIEFFNDSGLRLMQVSCAEDVLGRPWATLWPEEARPLVAEALAKAARGETTRFESYCPTTQGEFRWWDVLLAPIPATQGQAQRLIAVSRDITERHRHEQELQGLINTQSNQLSMSDSYLVEIHHRVKNSLHLVNTLLLLQANLAEDDAVKLQLRTAAGRVVTIATVHERLYQNAETRDVKVADYLGSLLGDIGKALADRQINLETDDLTLPPERMAPLGLVISELITNALKYGKGTIDVCVRQEADHALISVTDEGDGFPADYPKPSGTGLGMRLVKSYSGYGSGAVSVDRLMGKSRILVRFRV